tara:strand:- start:294 stop:815 length:522 start_codon:yes stop_codon:yes gene_type:complete
LKKSCQNFIGEHWVESRQRLICKHKLRPLVQQPSKCNPLSLTTRQVVNWFVQKIRFKSHFDGRIHAGRRIQQTKQIAECPEQVVTTECPSLDVLHGGQFLNKPKLLPERSQLTTLASGSLSQWFSLPMQSALIRLKRAVAEADQRTFARPAATEQNNPLAVVNLQVDGLKPSG